MDTTIITAIDLKATTSLPLPLFQSKFLPHISAITMADLGCLPSGVTQTFISKWSEPLITIPF